MSFTTKYFSGVVTGGGPGYNYTAGTFTAIVSADANDIISGTWTYSGSYMADGSTGSDPYVRDGSGNIAFSGTVTGALLPGFSDSWKVYFSSSDSRFDPNTYGFIDRVNGTFDMYAVVEFDLSFVNRFGLPISESFGAHNQDILASALPPVVSIDSYSGTVLENYGIATVTLARSGADLGAASTVFLSTEDGAAYSTGSSIDFNAVADLEVVFAPGQTSVTVNLGALIIDDRLAETNENFHIRIANPVNAAIGFATGDITIVDNDLTGSSGANALAAGSGNQSITGGGGNDDIDGGSGIDTAVYSGLRSRYTITPTATGYTVTDQSGVEGTDTLVNVERLLFADAKVAIDVDGDGGMAYRLYQAAFNRTPDIGGLGFQMNALDTGLMLVQVAANFIASPEFGATYGRLDDTQFVTQLYANVLHRAPDAGGLAYHVDHLAHGFTRADILVGFSESPENKAALIGTIENGMLYTL